MESTFATPYEEIRSEVGHLMGYGRGQTKGEPAWTAKRVNDIESCAKAGYDQFLHPPVLPGDTAPHNWSFLRPTTSLILPISSQALTLPDDFGAVEDNATISTSGTIYMPLRQMGESNIRARYSAEPGTTGTPQIFAIAPLRGKGIVKGQRFEMLVWPQSDQAYTIQVQYYILDNALTAQNPYPLGGAQHAQTVLESCLAIAEDRLDNQRTVHAQKFMERLIASVGMDRRNKPQFLGKNLDRSDDVANRLHSPYTVPTYNGASYS